ncbi:TetR/AcrR family transcriptional regulator [Acidiferrimicrobium sp. IK]|uniref:TetR/AcrR family transcriptional regulator n=1 Tax=Acidiferrimicrobium sp. IK TaxID=2871700 RepID=UPI0021CB7056|nr:TetR/AcrR family transcriptional regulator [Acidiferrimicrobium sp. IK]MCU4186074.1 TetR/AcrR family transcriptional regulator [Acidiferrimicrobium sp. IK]
MTPPGRPRDPQLDDAAMTAVIGLIVEGGYHGVSMDRIAARAGVSKAALYRRWPNKLALTVDAIAHLATTKVVVPDTGDVRADLVEFLLGFMIEKRADAGTYEALSAAIAADPDLAMQCRDTVIARFTAMFRGIVARGVERGQLPADTDVELLGDIAPALIRHRRQLAGEPLDKAYIDRIVAQFFRPCPS